MRVKLGTTATLLLALAIGVWGCGDDDDGAGSDADTDADTDTDTDTDADTDTGTGDGTITIQGQAVETDMSTPVPAADVCWHPNGEEPICDTTDDQGNYELSGVTPVAPGSFEAVKDGYVRYLFWMEWPPVQVVSFPFFFYTAADSEQLYDSAGQTPDPTKGTAILQVFDGAVPAVGAVAQLEPMSGTGPFYVSASSIADIDPEATGFTSSSLAVFTNVEPGEYELSATLDDSGCVAGFMNGEEMAFQVEAGTMSVRVLDCAK